MLKRLKKRLESIFKDVEEELEEKEVEGLEGKESKDGMAKEVNGSGEVRKDEGRAAEKSKALPLLTVKLDESKLDDLLWQVELAMLENNVAEEASSFICQKAKEKLMGKVVSRKDVGKVVKQAIRDVMEELLTWDDVDVVKIVEGRAKEGKPALILFFGFNGTGKTTTMAKVAKMLKDHGFSVVFAAADNFRAASIEQLEEHGSKLGIRVIKHKYGSDPAAVIFDAMRYAESKGINAVLADTAGRSHADRNLLEELKKIVRVNKPDLRILVLEAIAGNDIVEQARRFEEAGVDGIILTKRDVDERGGDAVSGSYVLKKPILFIGTGQNYEDLEKFDKKRMLDEIIGN